MLDRQFQAAAIGRLQQVHFAVHSAAPDRADGMKYKLRVQPSRRRGHGGASRATVWILLSGFVHQRWSTRVMNCPIHTAASQQFVIRRVDDRVDHLFSDVPLNKFEPTW